MAYPQPIKELYIKKVFAKQPETAFEMPRTALISLSLCNCSFVNVELIANTSKPLIFFQYKRNVTNNNYFSLHSFNSHPM